jgi:NADPH2:quinone reductase
MRALVFEQPASDATSSHVATTRIPTPEADEVSIDVMYAGVNFIDVMARRGDPGYASAWPFVPGMEVAGHVRALGSSVRELAVGDTVAAFTGSGGLAGVAIARASLVAQAPDGLGLDRAATAPGALATAALLIGDASRVRADDVVLVHSATGGVGQALAQFARLAGADQALGTVGNSERVAAAERAGYDAAFVRGPGLVEEVRERLGDRGVDVILDPQGTALLDVDLELAASVRASYSSATSAGRRSLRCRPRGGYSLSGASACRVWPRTRHTA